jgi:hypothetical protein
LTAREAGRHRAARASFRGGEVARRLDRLARRAHRFHRFAHHPLCAAYRGEVFHVGARSFVCRGCALALAGAGAGLIAGALAPVPPAPLLVALVAMAGVSVLRFVRPVPREGPRTTKLLSRAAPAALTGLAFALGLRAWTALGVSVSLAALAGVAAAVTAYRRRGPDRGPCQGCPERSSLQACSGYRRAARRERAFARVAARMLGERA